MIIFLVEYASFQPRIPAKIICSPGEIQLKLYGFLPD